MSIGIRHSVSKVELIFNIGFEIIGEAESVIEVNTLTSAILIHQEVITHLFWRISLIVEPGNCILHISYIVTSFKPANALIFISLFGPDTWFHTLLVQTGCLRQIEYIELNLMFFLVGMQRNISIY